MIKKADWGQKLNRDEYWMGVALLLAVRAPHGNACLVVDGDALVGTGMEGPPKFGHTSKLSIPADLDVMVNCEAPYRHANLYLTTTPSLAGLQAIVASMRVQRLVYYSSDKMKFDDSLIESVQVIKFEGNLNWLRDYTRSIG